MAQSKSKIRPIFTNQVKKLVEHAESMQKTMTNTGHATFFEPDKGEWDGDLFDMEGMAKAFDRTELHEDFRETVKKKDPANQPDSDQAGRCTDLSVEILQGDFVSMLERAYRHRHSTSVRDKIHAGARHMGHGLSTGVLQVGLQGYVEHLNKQVKS